jgi:putative oxidoreductase
MLRRIFATNDDRVSLLLRLILGVVMFPHGAQKMLGWFGGYGFSGSMGFFTQQLHIPAIFGFLAIVAEFFGSLALLAGFATRVAAAGIFTNMVVAVLTVHASVGFFMNWSGQQAGEGYEYHLLAIGIALALIIRGGGTASVDRALTRKS